MKPSEFEYHAPAALADAVDLLAELDDAKIVAGGQSLAPMMNLRLVTVGHLVDLRRLGELRRVDRTESSLELGALTTHRTIEHDATVAVAVPLLARAAPFIGHFQIRNRGTLGGSLAHADPAAELPTVAVTLDATIRVAGPNGSRSIAATDFFTGLWTTSLHDGEIVTGADFPQWPGRCGFAIEEFARRHGDFAVAGACVAIELGHGDEITRCSIGLLGLGPTPLRATTTELAAVGASVTELDPREVGRSAVSEAPSIPSDVNGSADYRAHIGAVVVARAWARAAEEASSV